jgi:hypothetical protein
MTKWADPNKQPRKPATPKQKIARTVNWGLLAVGGADANLGSSNYRLEDLLRRHSALLTADEQAYLRNAIKAMQQAQHYAVLARQSLRMFNVLRSKNHD